MPVPSLELGPPNPFPASECGSLPRAQVGVDTQYLGGEGSGETKGQKLWYSMYKMVPLRREPTG